MFRVCSCLLRLTRSFRIHHLGMWPFVYKHIIHKVYAVRMVHVYMYMCVRVWVCMWVCMYVYVYVCCKFEYFIVGISVDIFSLHFLSFFAIRIYFQSLFYFLFSCWSLYFAFFISTRNRGIDTLFIEKGMANANVVYSLHKTSTRAHFVKKAADSGIILLSRFIFVLSLSYPFT